LCGKHDSGAGAISVSAPVGQIETTPQSDADIIYDDAVEALGEDSFNAIAGALDMFRRG